MNYQDSSINALSWDDLQKLAAKEPDRINGPTNSYSTLRLFGQPEEKTRITLFRDHHAWCPYCQKIWLWLEWKQIPYRIKKVTMRCYGRKESWYLKKVPSGMLPALELDQRLITESDQILLALEDVFGPLGKRLEDHEALKLRNLERKLFHAWCIWLCRPGLNQRQEKESREQFQCIAREMERNLIAHEGPFLDTLLNNKGLQVPGSCDVIFIPYLERMNASLAYYKGFSLQEEHPAIQKWFNSLQKLEVYRGTQGDIHTHSHDLPPQMGGCWTDPNPNQKSFSKAIDLGEGLGELETSFVSPKEPRDKQPAAIALGRVLKHRKNLLRTNPIGEDLLEQPLRAALTNMVMRKSCPPNHGSAYGLRYLRDRISVPRDMPLLEARCLRQALEKTAQIDGTEQGPSIPTRNRLDQNPQPFL